MENVMRIALSNAALAAVAALLAFAQYGAAARAFVFQPVPSMGGPAASYPADFGYNLGVTYLVWAAVVVPGWI